MSEPLTRIHDLAVSFDSEGRVRLRSSSKRVAGRFDPEFVLVLSFCSAPHTREEVAKRFGPAGGRAFDQLASAGFLVSPAEADVTPHFYQGFFNVNLQRAMLADRARLNSYREAITRVVRPGDVVIDAGTGSGILAVYAARAGARRVYAIDHAPMIDLAKEMIAQNGLAHRIEVVRGDFAQVVLPEKARVLVTETFGAMLFTEGAGRDLAACVRHSLQPGGCILPAACSLYLGGLARASDEVLAVFGKRPDGVELAVLRDLALRRALLSWVDPPVVTGTCCLGRFAPTTDPSEATVTMHAALEGPCAALAGWFELHLTDGVTLSTAPGSECTSWQQVVFPVELPPGRHQIALSFAAAADDRRRVEVEFGPPVNRTIRI